MEFENPRPATSGPQGINFEHNNSGQNSVINPITGEIQILKAPLLKENLGKFNVLTNQDKNGPTQGYETYSETQSASRRSNNVCYLPQDLYVECPITGRKIMKKE